MSQFKYTSWGRTRGPKPLTSDAAVAQKQTATEVTLVAAAALNDALDDATAGENGYATENQEYLHLQLENNATTDTVTLYGYNYAFGSWAILKIPVGFTTQAVTDPTDPADFDNAIGQAASTADTSYINAQFTSISGKYMVTVPIHGIDRIGFAHDGAKGGQFKVRAACSTL